MRVGWLRACWVRFVRHRSGVRFAIGGAVLAGIALAWWLSRPVVPVDADPAHALLQRIDAARGAALDPAVARLLHDAAVQLAAQAARTTALEARLRNLEIARGAPGERASPPPIAPTLAPGRALVNAATERQRELQRLVASGASAADARAMLAFVDELALQEAETRYRLYRAGRAGGAAARDANRQSMQELRRLGDVQGELREAFGDEAFDRYLYAKELPNRVRVTAVLPRSVAERAGLQAGDVLLSYDGKAVRSVDEVLRFAVEGNEGDSVDIVALRGNERQQLTVPRGPLGFRGEAVSVNPAVGGR